VLLGLALEQLGLSRDALSLASQVELLQHCRELKEAINSNTRKIHVEVERHISKRERDRLELTDGKSVVVSVDAYDAACGPLLEHTLDLLRLTLGAGGASTGAESESGDEDGEDAVRGIAGLYVVGGASALPAVTRCLRNTYGRRVKRSPYPSAAIAIGLAIAADDAQSYDLQDRFHHNLGVFREIHGGMQIGFDRIIGPDTLVPAKGGSPVRLSRRYRATHNIGHYRFIECGWLDDLGHPSGDIKPFAEVRFPFDPELRGHNDLSRVSVARSEAEGPEIEELYSISEYGTVELTIHDRASGYERHYKIAG
jgi:molecular chaperone DnaK (HSP70)